MFSATRAVRVRMLASSIKPSEKQSHVPDTLEDVTEVKPVTRLIAPSEDILDEGVNVTLARRVLRADQQTLLEESVHDVPVECLRHECKLDEGNRELHRVDLQKWMQDWHQKLKACLKADIIAVEAKTASAQQGSLPLLSNVLKIIPSKAVVSDGMKTVDLHGRNAELTRFP
ncbi:hypothetical protein EDB19DRAFT_1833424 [Suillus lakei]|nr:hypothetical protein EDB19DRAFT_1833424 [Suillus lakei]